MLCVFLVAIGVALGALLGRPVQRPEPFAAAGPVRINGTAAVRPDRISAMLRLTAHGATGGSSDDPDAADMDLTEQEDSGPLHPVDEPVTDPVLRTVTSFYQLVDTAPADAFDLLGRRLKGSGYPGFASAWAKVVQVRINGVAKVAPRAAVLAVYLDRARGPALRTLQRLVVGHKGRIQGATLLTATADRRER